MIVNRSNLTGVFVNLKTSFNKAFEAAKAQWQEVATLIPSTASSNDYSWLSRFPKMREWIGEKNLKRLEAFKYSLVNRNYEATVEVRRDDIEDDQLGIYGPMAAEAGYSSKQLPDELVFSLVNGGFAALCYDGQYFFDTDHLVNGASVSNKGTAALKADTAANALASYGAGRSAVMSLKDDEGRPMNLVPDVLLVPPALEATANALMNNERLEDGKPNPYKGTAKVVVCGWFTDATAWFLLVTGRALKPFIYQERKAPVFVEQTDMNNDNVFMKGEYKFGRKLAATPGTASGNSPTGPPARFNPGSGPRGWEKQNPSRPPLVRGGEKLPP